MKFHRWTRQEEQLISELYQSGMSAVKIAERLGVTQAQLYGRLHKMRAENNGSPPYRYSGRSRIVPISEVKRFICATYRITENELVGERRTSRVVEPRQIAMALAYKLSGMSTTVVGQKFDGRDHATVIHAIQASEKRYAERMAEIEKRILASRKKEVA